MKITVFTGNQPRHISLVETMAQIADEVFVVQECNTLFPGQVPDFFRKSEVMQRYFARVLESEALVFGRPRFLGGHISHLAIKSGDLNLLERDALAPALDADAYVVFGADYITGALCEHLVEQRAYNIHMGTSPYYRGNSCNFWALHDHRPDYLGATIHLLSKGLDSGPILFHALPKAEEVDGFLLGMKSVKAAHDGLKHYLGSGGLRNLEPIPQDKTLQYRYTRNADFTDAVAAAYLNNPLSPRTIAQMLAARDSTKFVRPYIA